MTRSKSTQIFCILLGVLVSTTPVWSNPVNDYCSNAIPIGEVTNLAFDTTSATYDGSGSCMYSSNIWYLYTATCSGNATVSLCGSSFDTKLAVYNGSSCNPMGTLLACNDDSSCGLPSQVIFSATAGNQYLIEVGGYSTYTGQGVLSITCGTAAIGACCDSTSGYCTQTEQSNCYYNWLGAGSSCGSCAPAGCNYNGICDSWESPSNCTDCQSGPVCGNTICEPGEQGWCPDCPMGCNYNGICDPWENPSDCPDCHMIMMGACCRNDGMCSQTDQYSCYDGQWQGPGSSCGMCAPVIGACCDPIMGCMGQTTQNACPGMWQGPGSTCSMCPPPMMMGACCRNDGTCWQTNQYACDGQWQGPGYPCGMCPPVLGACCSNDGTCTQTDSTGCYAGLWEGPGSLCGNCPPVTGACCDEQAGYCTETTQNECRFMWHGAGSTCGSTPCTMILQMGACCRSDGTCMDTDPGGCNGMWQGPGSSCGMCPPAMGACCMPTGECMQFSEWDCQNMGGSFNGPGSTCVDSSCPRPTGACCDTMGGYCYETSQDTCYGMWNGTGSTCASTPCTMIPPMEGCCMPDGSCIEVRMGDCSIMGGMSSGSSCGAGSCPQPGACCMGPGNCMRTTAFGCYGEWRGEGTDCQACEGPISACCLGPGMCMELTMRECMARGGVSIASCGQADCPGVIATNPVPPWQSWNCPRPEDCPPPDAFGLVGRSGRWFEPNIAYGYLFKMTEPNNAVFTQILDFPTGFDNPFTIDVNGVSVGAFGPGQSVDFVTLTGQGVREFILKGVSPLTDPENGQIFPIQLAFNVQEAQFTMTPLMTVDVDRNEKVDFLDFSKLVPAWNSNNCCSPDWCGGADINHDGSVNIQDLAIFSDYWLWKLPN